MIGKTVSHYKILEKLGQGGMGVVYKAEDTKLRRAVALKFLSADAIGSEEAKSRFIYEAQAAAALDHPNICTVHEIDESDGQAFIVMALVEGRSLRERIASGPLKIDEALDIAIQTAEGLNEAHAKGIVHRDVKPSNLMISSSGQARIMDFGLARSAEQTKITKTGTTLGTVAYMSPEQARGDETDHRTDIWSLGVMLYEMITVRLPFKGAAEQALIYSILNEEPDPITGLRAGVPIELERIVGKALAKRADERYQHIDEMLTDLRTLKRDIGLVTTPTPVRLSVAERSVQSRKRLVWLVPICVAVMAAIAAFVATKLWQRGPELDPDRVVVATFENRTGDESLDHIGQMAADWITQGLSQTDEVNLVPTTVAMRGRGTADEGQQEMEKLLKLAEVTGAGVVVSGAYYLDSDNLQIQAKVTDAANGTLIFALEPISGSRSTPMKQIEVLQKKVMGALVSHLGLTTITGMDVHPPVYEAYREHVAGLSAFGVDFETAARHFTRAAELDSTFMSPRVFLVWSLMNLGMRAEADSLIQVLRAGQQRLTPYQRLYVEVVDTFMHHDYPEAMRFLRLLEKKSPNAGDVNILIGLVAVRTNRPQMAVEAFERFVVPEDEGSFTFDSWRYEIWANALHMLGEHQEELKVLRRAREIFPDAVLLRDEEIAAYAGLGRVDEVQRVLDECMSMSDEIWIQCAVLGQAVLELRAHGQQQEASKLMGRALTLYQDLQDEAEPSEYDRYATADMLYSVGLYDEAQDLFEKLSADHPDEMDYQGYLGCLAARRGEREEALRVSEEMGRLDRPFMFGSNTYWRACIASLLGERERAVEFLREAIAQGDRYGMLQHSDPDLDPLRDYPPFQEFMRTKE